MRPAVRKWTTILAAGMALAACQAEEPDVAEERPDPVVRVARVDMAPLAETRRYTGTVVPRTEVPEAFRVGGKVAARLVDVGERVEKGQILARLDPADLELQLAQRRAERRAAQTGLETAEAEAERARTLFERGHVTKAALDQRLLARDEARSRLDQAERLERLAANQRDYAVLRATTAGAVSAAPVEVGQVVTAGQTVVTVARLDAKEVEVAIPESRLADLEGSTARATLWAGERSYAAKLREIAPEADGTSRTYPVRFAIPQADAAMRLGMTATVALSKGDPAPVARVPMTALLNDGRGAVVFVVDPDADTLSRRPVTVAAYHANEAIIDSGLRQGERIVTLGVQKLEDGARVRVSQRRSASAE